mmetsp:Transcript_100659/g.289244  ORF Transcript_100659/g.289244 Transcript_100659/m.289244 type:complete len:333 (+) Transcript_100659:103-1101(+)
MPLAVGVHGSLRSASLHRIKNDQRGPCQEHRALARGDPTVHHGRLVVGDLLRPVALLRHKGGERQPRPVRSDRPARGRACVRGCGGARARPVEAVVPEVAGLSGGAGGAGDDIQVRHEAGDGGHARGGLRDAVRAVVDRLRDATDHEYHVVDRRIHLPGAHGHHVVVGHVLTELVSAPNGRRAVRQAEDGLVDVDAATDSRGHGLVRVEAHEPQAALRPAPSQQGSKSSSAMEARSGRAKQQHRHNAHRACQAAGPQTRATASAAARRGDLDCSPRLPGTQGVWSRRRGRRRRRRRRRPRPSRRRRRALLAKGLRLHEVPAQRPGLEPIADA